MKVSGQCAVHEHGRARRACRFATVAAAMLARASRVRNALCGVMSTLGNVFSSWNFLRPGAPTVGQDATGYYTLFVTVFCRTT